MRMLFLATLVPAIALAQGSRSDMVLTTFSEPCRIIDTRTSSGPIAGGFSRSFLVAGADGFNTQGGKVGGCGIPTTATAALINFVAVNPAGAGNLRAAAYPALVPAVGSIINYQLLFPNLNIANELLFPICDRSGPTACTFDITVQANGAGTHLVADVFGYAVVAHNQTVVVRAGPDAIQNGIALEAALAGIKLNSATSPYLLKLEPGIYEIINQLVMKAYVDIEGSGVERTVIRRTGTNGGPAVFGPGNANLRLLTIEDLSTDDDVIALGVNGDSGVTRLEYVTLRAVGGLTQAYGFDTDAFGQLSPTLDHVTVEVQSTASNAIGIRTNLGSLMSVKNSSIKMTGNGTKTGVSSHGSTTFEDVEITIRGTATTHTGMEFGTSLGSGLPTLRNVRASVTEAATNRGITAGVFRATLLSISVVGGSSNYGIVLDGSSGLGASEITDSKINVASGSILNDGVTLNNGFFNLRNVYVFANGGLAGSGVYLAGGNAQIDRCVIYSDHQSLFPATSGTSMNVGGSKIINPVSVGPGAFLTCVASYNGNYAALGPGCT